MKAVVLTNYGSADYFQRRELPRPEPADNEVLINIHASCINSWDWEILMGKPFVNRLMVGLRRPTKIKILGCDIAGRVAAIGSKVRRFRVGDEVFGDLSNCGWGGFAEYVCVAEDKQLLAIKPAVLSWEETAAVPQAGVLALQGLRKGDIGQAGSILINGASGGVGSFAVPMAKAYGAEVTGVCSTGKMDFVAALGADRVIDYTREDFTRNGRQYDLILDVQGQHSILDYQRALSPSGRYVMVGGASGLINQVLLYGIWVSWFGRKKMGLLLHKPGAGDLRQVTTLIEAGTVKPVVDRSYSLDKLAEAFRYYAAGKARGKVAITIRED